ncbi:MAG: homoserine dehydrogenase [Chloroflexi bacterium]|nr:homoserine dehydrogenase [Chloroflexota bacterium]
MTSFQASPILSLDILRERGANVQTSRCALIGVGNIGRRFLQIVAEKQDLLRARYGLQLMLVAVADSSGAALSDSGLDIQQVLQLKQARRGVAAYPGCGVSGLSALAALEKAKADLLIELSPTNLQHGDPGLSAITWALEHGLDVVTANKGPLVLAYQRLAALAAEKGRSLLFSGAVAGGLPTVNIGWRDLVGTKIRLVEGIFNTTTNYILSRMLEDNLSFAKALAGAQEAGVAEADPALDIDGWDAANKLVIVANSVLGVPTTLKDVTVQGIRDVTREDMLRAQQNGRAIKLLATAVPAADQDPKAPTFSRYDLAVRPTELPLTHPLARLTRWQMGVAYTSDIMGVIVATIEEEGTTATSGAVLRDVIHTITARR